MQGSISNKLSDVIQVTELDDITDEPFDRLIQ